MADQIRVNGNVHSWGSITVKIDGVKYHGLTSITYGDKRERTHQWGMGKHQAPRGRSRGKYTPNNGKLGGPKSTIEAIRAALAQKGGGSSFGDSEFQIVIQYVEKGDTPLLVEIEQCVIVGDESTEEESGDPLKEEVEYQPMRIKRNGRTLYDSSGGSP